MCGEHCGSLAPSAPYRESFRRSMFSVPFADQGDRIVHQFAARLGALHGLRTARPWRSNRCDPCARSGVGHYGTVTRRSPGRSPPAVIWLEEMQPNLGSTGLGSPPYIR